MFIYVANVLLILSWWGFYSLSKGIARKGNHVEYSENESNGILKGEQFFLILCFIQLYLIISLKNYLVGTDTVSYLNGFNAVINLRWQDVFNLKLQNLVFNFERGFIILTKFITVFTKDFTLYSAIIYALMILPLYRFIKRNSTMPFLSLILFIAFGFLNFYFSGMRQALAISIVLLSYEYIKKEKSMGVRRLSDSRCTSS